MASVFIPAQLRELTAGQQTVDLPGTTVREIVAALEARFPGIRDRLCTGEGLAVGLAVSVDGVYSNRGLRTPVGPSSEVHFLPALGGG